MKGLRLTRTPTAVVVLNSRGLGGGRGSRPGRGSGGGGGGGIDIGIGNGAAAAATIRSVEKGELRPSSEAGRREDIVLLLPLAFNRSGGNGVGAGGNEVGRRWRWKDCGASRVW